MFQFLNHPGSVKNKQQIMFQAFEVAGGLSVADEVSDLAHV